MSTKKVKAIKRRIEMDRNETLFLDFEEPYTLGHKVFILPDDAASYERMREQIEASILPKLRLGGQAKQFAHYVAIDALAAININPPKKEKRK